MLETPLALMVIFGWAPGLCPQLYLQDNISHNVVTTSDSLKEKHQQQCL